MQFVSRLPGAKHPENAPSPFTSDRDDTQALSGKTNLSGKWFQVDLIMRIPAADGCLLGEKTTGKLAVHSLSRSVI
jgi:hypothetical protein